MPLALLPPAAAQVFRNYFAPMPDGVSTGQTAGNQLNNLADVEASLDNGKRRFFEVHPPPHTHTHPWLANPPPLSQPPPVSRNHLMLVSRNHLMPVSRNHLMPGSRVLPFFQVSNGYVFAEDAGLEALNEVLPRHGSEEAARLGGLLRVGVHADVQVADDRASTTPAQ